VTKYLSPSRPLNEAESFRLFCQVLGHAQVRGFGYWAVRRQVDQAWLGVVGLWFPEGWPGVELGWRFESDHWGQGYATEAARAAFDYARTTLHLTEVISIVHTENERSARLARRLGMSQWKTRSVGDVGVTIFRWCENEADEPTE
jgi:RimJ/RimL family protein N-acetyltransferase